MSKILHLEYCTAICYSVRGVKCTFSLTVNSVNNFVTGAVHNLYYYPS